MRRLARCRVFTDRFSKIDLPEGHGLDPPVTVLVKLVEAEIQIKSDLSVGSHATGAE